MGKHEGGGVVEGVEVEDGEEGKGRGAGAELCGWYEGLEEKSTLVGG